ncbi:unnamed protein product [Gongylonema pulchrum]|uniref:Zinc finger protein ZPR1 n=1 Tax=Gongylonema pulchrum TaxID=637853 RepID=A0A183E482_9BILA|nr:unnamed protein product [Gongylonema pulchrum]
MLDHQQRQDERATGNEDTPLFTDLCADSDDAVPMQVESLCVNCKQNGITRILCTNIPFYRQVIVISFSCEHCGYSNNELQSGEAAQGITRILCTNIPFYRQVIVISFSCEHCGYSNNELQSGEAAQEHGVEITLRVRSAVDLNRQVVKSEYAEIEIKELELSVPPKTQTGEITTVEGVLRRVINGLNQDQLQRRETDPENAEKIDRFIEKIENLLNLQDVFTLRIRDVSGNSFVQNPNPLHVDEQCVIVRFSRNLADNKLLGLVEDDAENEDAKNEVLRFTTDCPNCGAPTETCMKPTDIPFFATVILMCTVCDACGYKSNEVKSGAADVDFARDVLKSESCSMSIPELDLAVGPGALSGRFTTVEGLLVATRDQLKEQGQFFLGDSTGDEDAKRMQEFLDKFEQILQFKMKIHLVLDDPTGNSYIQGLNAPMDDSRLTKDFYERTDEQNDELGLNDMKTENYGELETVKEE